MCRKKINNFEDFFAAWVCFYPDPFKVVELWTPYMFWGMKASLHFHPLNLIAKAMIKGEKEDEYGEE